MLYEQNHPFSEKKNIAIVSNGSKNILPFYWIKQQCAKKVNGNIQNIFSPNRHIEKKFLTHL